MKRKHTTFTITYVPGADHVGGVWWQVVGTALQGHAPSRKLAERDAKADIAKLQAGVAA